MNLKGSEQQFHRWQGLGASPGTVTGKAHIIRTEQDFAEVGESDILVARHATPALFPGLIRAQAAVCETGGILNHLAVLARELRKPCVTNLPGIVDALEPGTPLRVDGAKGLVELIMANRQAPVPAPRLVEPEAAMVPVFQFGFFSAAFEHIQACFDIEIVVRTAALVSLPVAFGVGSVWEFAIAKNKILIAAASLRTTIDTLVDGLERGSLQSASMHGTYLDLCAWHGWSTLDSEHLDPQQLGIALCHLVRLNQITWTATIAKEPLTRRYRTFLFDRLAHLNQARRDQLFLDSLIMPDRSYILRSCLAGEGSTTIWSHLTNNHRVQELRDETTTRAQDLRTNARHHYLAVLQHLKAQLSDQDFQQAMSYLATIADLVDLTERKNTDLYQCGRALFGSNIHRAAITRLCGISDASMIDDSWEEGRRRLVEIVLEKLQNWGSLEAGSVVVSSQSTG